MWACLYKMAAVGLLCSAMLLEGLLLLLAFWMQGVNTKEYCIYDAFKASCKANQVIDVTKAKYGRMQQGDCIEDNYGQIGCQADVLHILDNMCSGQQECSIISIPAMFKEVNVCPKGLTTYLEVIFTCTEVFLPSVSQCESSFSTFAPPPPGILANLVTAKTGCGDQQHPWIIEVSLTQKINLTLYDYGTRTTATPFPCIQYAIVREPNINEDTTICGGIKRKSQVFVSHGNKVELSLASPQDINGVHFLVKYEAIGCEEPKYPSDMWMKAGPDGVIIGCYTSKVTWKLTCKGTTWDGTIGNCTTLEISNPTHSNATWILLHTVDSGGLTFLVAAVAVIITIGILVVALLYTNRSPPPVIALGSLDEPYEAKDIAFFRKDPRDSPQHEPQAQPIQQTDSIFPIPRESCVSMPVSNSDSDTYASENATLPLRACEMEDFDATLQPPLPSKIKPNSKPFLGTVPPPELPPKCPPKVGHMRKPNDLGPYTRLNTDNCFGREPPRHYKTLQMDNMNQTRPLPPVPMNSV